MDSGEDTIRSFFRPGGPLERLHPRYDYRPQQEAMAAEVWKALAEGNVLLAEAGTGVGKSLAYLYPLLLWQRRAELPFAVSTHTKTLQRQLLEQDLPLLERLTGEKIRAALCLGAGNYLCRLRLDRARERGLFETRAAAAGFQAVSEWAAATATGMVQELAPPPSPDVWGAVSVEQVCPRRKCPHYRECWYFSAREQARSAQVLVMNHHLFFANLAVGGAVLPPFGAAVFDEAHTLEDVATSFLGFRVSNRTVPNLLGNLYSARGGKGFIPATVADAGERALWQESIEVVRRANDDFFERLQALGKGGKQTLRLRVPGYVDNLLDAPLEALEDRLRKLRKELPEADKVEAVGYQFWVQELRRHLEELTGLGGEDRVYWYEQEGSRRRLFQSLQMAPVEVGNYLRERLWSELAPAVLTSATLSTGGNFEYLKKSLGLEDCAETVQASPFDYQNRVLVYTDPTIPDPRRDPQGYEARIVADIDRIVRAVGGGAFVLFTSHRMLRRAWDELNQPLAGFGCLRQGEKERYLLLEEFRRRPASVLFGTASFWQGVDVPGESLRCVVIVKLPFGVPDEPLTESRLELIAEGGGDPFNDYQVPRAVIMLRQGFGRLMRHRDDYGVVAFLDPRIRTRPYGRKFLGALPRCRVTTDFEQLNAFVTRVRREGGGAAPGPTSPEAGAAPVPVPGTPSA
ncbi:MAG TPA: ATP-dependent DNA helicase [bacterium]|nr:ATP-dependent DNA helicase [bacterium]HPQ65340.1 ATP-dependent DNA helicase [bacterium]